MSFAKSQSGKRRRRDRREAELKIERDFKQQSDMRNAEINKQIQNERQQVQNINKARTQSQIKARQISRQQQINAQTTKGSATRKRALPGSSAGQGIGGLVRKSNFITPRFISRRFTEPTRQRTGLSSSLILQVEPPLRKKKKIRRRTRR